jgi:hypothetical protein
MKICLIESSSEGAMGSRHSAPRRLVRFAKSWLVKPPNSPFSRCQTRIFRGFAGLARSLNCIGHRSAKWIGGEKREIKMSGQSNITRTLVAAFAAVLMSTVAVGAAVGPAQAVANPVGTTVHA